MNSENRWDQRYAAKEFYYGTEPNDFLRKMSAMIPANGEVLCLAEGEGRNAVWLASRGFRVTGVDGSAIGLRKMQELATKRGVQVTGIHADLENFPIEPTRWDAVVSIWCHLPKPLRRKVYSAVVSGLKPQGILILEAYIPDQLTHKTGGPPTADLMPTLAELRDELEGLELLSAQELEREVHEGAGHNGLSAVVQVVARKKE